MTVIQKGEEKRERQKCDLATLSLRPGGQEGAGRVSWAANDLCLGGVAGGQINAARTQAVI